MTCMEYVPLSSSSSCVSVEGMMIARAAPSRTVQVENYKTDLEIWRDNAVQKVLALQTLGPEPQYHPLNRHVGRCAWTHTHTSMILYWGERKQMLKTCLSTNLAYLASSRPMRNPVTTTTTKWWTKLEEKHMRLSSSL